MALSRGEPLNFNYVRDDPGLHYYFSSKFPNSPSYHLSLGFKPQGRTKESGVQTIGEFIGASGFIDNYALLGIEPVEA